jgi:regulator of cell morphogenesis and NO signaling
MTTQEAILDSPIGQLAADDMKKALIFQKLGLDFCCGGKKTVREACVNKGLNIKDVQEMLQNIVPETNSCSVPPNKMSLSMLIEYIKDVHHRYVKQQIPIIIELLDKTTAAHGTIHPELDGINGHFRELSSELLQHLEKEEQVLFPAIERVYDPELKNSPVGLIPPVAVMEKEHEKAGVLMQEIRDKSHHFTPPSTACYTFKLLYNQLEAFEEDLHMHIHLENNILFPKVTRYKPR